MSRAEYLAGFFDGEGCIGAHLNGRKTGRTLSLQLVQNHSPASEMLFDELQAQFGGSVGRQKTLSGKTKLNWQVAGANAASVLRVMRPHMRIKRDQAEVALAWFDSRTNPGRDERGRIIGLSEEQRARDREVCETLTIMKGRRMK